MDAQRIRFLLDRRDEIDREIQTLVNGSERKQIKCSTCGGEGHTARTCPKKAVTLGDLNGGV